MNKFTTSLTCVRHQVQTLTMLTNGSQGKGVLILKLDLVVPVVYLRSHSSSPIVTPTVINVPCEFFTLLSKFCSTSLHPNQERSSREIMKR